MVYCLLVICSICISLMAIVRKKYDETCGSGIFEVSFFMLLQGLIVSLALIGYKAILSDTQLFAGTDLFVIICACATGICTAITTVICINGTKYGNLTLLIMFATLGSLVLSAVYGIIFDAERNGLNIYKIIGFVLTVTILVLSLLDRNTNDVEKTIENRDSELTAQHKKIYVLLCIIVFFTNGIVLVFYSIMTKYRPAYAAADFITLYMATLVLLSMIVCAVVLILRKTQKDAKLPTIKKKSMILIAIYSMLILTSELISYRCTAVIPIVVQAPLSFTAELLFTGIADYVFFKSKPSRIQIVQMLFAVVSSVCFVV